ncbi:MAG: amidase [Gammaproteobacteria bacterium]|nr:amidase [Gammaproteobacteria bacterium]
MTESCLQRLDSVNPTINAMTEVRANMALTEADSADAKIASGDTYGLLHGVPVSIKGNVDLAGWATVNGCSAFKDSIAENNSDCVQNWLNAGAIVIGRTNTPEFCCRWETSNEVFGATHNPWNTALTPGGSSGGAAASVACGITALAHGTDLGGSLRDPAQACGIASIKPTLGRVADWVPSEPGDPAIGVQMMNTDGVMARRVADVRLGLQAMSAASWHDPWWNSHKMQESNRERRVALVKDPAGGGIHPQVADGLEKAGQLLNKAGYQVEETEPPGIEEAADVWKTVCIGELTNLLAPSVKEICGERMRTMFGFYEEIAGRFSAENYMLAFARRKKLLREWNNFFSTYSLIVAPICTQSPYATDSDLESREKVEEIMHNRRMMVAISALSLPAAVVPVGIADELPQAVQIIGPAYQEMDCLAAAEAIEKQVGSITPIDPKQ